MINNVIHFIKELLSSRFGTGMNALYFIILSCFILGVILCIFHFIKSLNILS